MALSSNSIFTRMILTFRFPTLTLKVTGEKYERHTMWHEIFAPSTSAIRKKKTKKCSRKKKNTAKIWYVVNKWTLQGATFVIPFEYLPHSGYCQPSGDFSPIVPNSPFLPNLPFSPKSPLSKGPDDFSPFLPNLPLSLKSPLSFA